MALVTVQIDFDYYRGLENFQQAAKRRYMRVGKVKIVIKEEKEYV